MSRFSHLPSWMIWTLCIAILAARMGGLHLHFCLDGKQAISSVQAGQVGSDEFKPHHQDTDVSLVGDTLIKNIDSATVLPVLLTAAVLLFMLATPRNAGFSRFFDRFLIPDSLGFYFRPPLRGPPR